MGISSIGAIGTQIADLAQPPQLSEQDRSLIRAVRSVNDSGVMGDSNEITYQYDRAARCVVVRVVDRESGDVMDQIPAEYVLKLAEKISGG